MPLWRCPHCGTPQLESSRCWVCRRSTTSCAACRHFRRGVAGGLGLCGRDPRHLALHGTEMRACWEAADTTWTMGPPEEDLEDPARVPVMAPAVAAAYAGSRPVRTFVPVESLAPRGDAQARARQAVSDGEREPDAGIGVMTSGGVRASPPPMPARRIPGGWSLWGDFEP